MTSPSHHRDLSGTERQRVQELLSGIEVSLNGNSNPSSVPLCLSQLLEIVEGDETLCGGLVKTTKVVVITRRVLELYRFYNEEASGRECVDVKEAEMRQTILESPAVQISSRILRVLVENAHSRRSFSAILPQSCKGFLYLLRCVTTASDITRVLCHVLLHTQEGKEVLDELVSQHNFTGILTQLCLDCVERSRQQSLPHDDEICLLLDVLRLLSASVSVTPRPDSATILSDVCGLVVTVLSPLICSRGAVWYATMNINTHRLLSTLLSEALLLCSVLVYESIDARYVNEVEVVAEDLIQRWRAPNSAGAECGVSLPEHLVMFWRGCKALPREEELSYQREHSEEEATALQLSTDMAALLPLIIRRMKRELCTIRKYNLDSATVQKCLFTIHGDLAGGGGGTLQSSQVGSAADGGPTLATRKRVRSNIAELSSYVIARVPGGVKTLCGTLSTVDEEISSVSCAVLTSLFNACNASILSTRQPSAAPPGLSLTGSQLFATASTSSTSSHPIPNPTLPHSKFVAEDIMMHNAIDQFVSLDGVLLLADMLDDYSEDVLTGAFSVLASLLPYHKAVKDVLSNGVLEKVRSTFEGVTARLRESIISHPLQQKQMVITVTVMCFEFVARVPQFALAPLVNMGTTIRDVSNLIEGRLWGAAEQPSQPTDDGGPSRESSVALIMAPFLRAVTNLLSIDAANVLDGLGLFDLQWCERWLSAASSGGVDTFTASLYSIQALLTCVVSSRSELIVEQPERLSRLVEIIHSLAMALFGTALEASRQKSLQTQFWTLVDTIVSNQSNYGIEISERLKDMLVDALIGALQVLAATGHEYPTFVSATLPPISNLLLQWNVLRRSENVLNLVGSVAVSEWAAISDRSRCISLLQSICSAPPESLATDEERAVALSFSSHYPLLLTRVIMLCEEYCGTLSVDDESELSCLANLCFSSLLDLPRLSVPALVGVGATALHYLVNPEGVGFAALGWLGFMEDADDAHDTLVAVVPLINGILNQSTASRTSLSSNDNFVVFFAQLIACEALEVPLKVLGLYSLWHLLASEGDGRGVPESHVAALLIKWNIISLLEMLLAAAKAEGQSAEATAEIKHACYLLAERVTILSRSSASLSAAAASESFLEQTIRFLASNAFEDSAMEGQACSYLLCLLQDDALRSALHHHPDAHVAAAYRESLNKLYQSVTAEMESVPQHYYVILQLNKYIAEFQS